MYHTAGGCHIHRSVYPSVRAVFSRLGLTLVTDLNGNANKSSFGSLFYLTIPLEQIDFDIIGCWMWSL